MKGLKKILSMVTAMGMVITLVGQPTQATAKEAPVPGVTVEENTLFTETTPDAHYQTTFTLDTSLFEKEITKVEVGGNMQFYTEDQLSDYLKNENEENSSVMTYSEFVLPGYTAYEYESNMFTTGIALDLALTGQANYLYELEPTEENPSLYTVTIPLPGGQYYYDYFITYADGEQETIKDPANLPVANGESDSGHSLFYVGNGNDCISGEEYVFPRTDGVTGTLDFVDYTASDGSTQSLGVYLPYGYDQTHPYKTLYLSHGGGGNEVEWFYIGSAKNIFDNLIAEGYMEPTVIVTMDNQNAPFSFEKGESLKNITENIIPFIEENYSVSTERAGRAMAGLSSGASVTCQAILQANDVFDYYGVFSPSRTLDFAAGTLTDEMRADMKDAAKYYVSCGIYDAYLRRNVDVKVYEELVASGADATYEWKNGTHDWAVWRAQLTTFAKDYLWTKESQETPVPGVTIAENTDYPDTDANYQVTFTYKASSEAVQSVSLVGNFTFYTEEQAKEIMGGKDSAAHTPYEYKDGMFQTGYGVSELGYVPLELTNLGNGYFQITLPLPGCQYCYGFIENTDPSKVYKDPTNLPIANGDSDSGWSLIYVGNANDCLEGQEYIYPRTDGKTGTLEFVEYTAVDGTTQPLGVYLPYGYDSNKEYKTLYVSHGGGGNEVEWFYIGSAINIMDNLIAEGEVEPTIVVTMDNSYFNWDMDPTNKNLVENIIPYVEANYSAASGKDNRAMAGLSNGGYTTVNEMIHAQDVFGYYGIFSPNYRSVNVLEEATEEQLKALAGSIYYECSGTVDNGMGRQDRYGTVNTVYETLVENGADVVLEWKNGAHDWGIWRASLSTFAKDYLWTKDTTPTNPDEPDTPNIPDHSTDINTGDNTNIMPVVLTGMMALAVGAVVVYKKKKETVE